METMMNIKAHNNILLPDAYFLSNKVKGALYDHEIHPLNRIMEAKIKPSWPSRMNMALGIAKGLAHLHEHSMIHGSLRSSCIFVREDSHAVIGECGIGFFTSFVVRSGYKDPYNEQPSVMGDIYAFGAILLELASGLSVAKHPDLPKETQDGISESLVDKKLKKDKTVEKNWMTRTVRLASLCVHKNPHNRPSMKDVVSEIEKEIVTESIVEESKKGSGVKLGFDKKNRSFRR